MGTNTKCTMKTPVSLTTGSISLKKRAETNLKVKVQVSKTFPTPLQFSTTKLSLKSSSFRSKTSKKTFYISLFFFVDVVISYYLIQVPKNNFFSILIFCCSLPTFPTKKNHLVLADILKVAVPAETSSLILY